MIDLGNGVKLVTRAEWGARAPRARPSLNATYGSTGHWEGPHMGSFPHSSCATKVRGIQRFHMDPVSSGGRGWQDIAYSLLPCPHGYVYEGRGPNVRTAANGTNQGNNTAGAVCYLGGEGDPFTVDGKRAMRAAFDYLDRSGHGPRRNGHRDWKNTKCPGDEIYRWVHAGQPAPGPVTPPAPVPPKPAPPAGDDDMLHLVQATGDPRWAITDMVNGRRHMRTVAQAARLIWNHVAAGGKVAHDGKNGPIPYAPGDLADLPWVGQPEAVETATALDAKALRAELARLTREVTAWKAAVEAAASQATG